jgi:D-alanine--poly(phosphoribitol) ligase subunit 1
MAINSMDGIQRACCIYQQDENKIYAFYEGEADNKSLTHYLVSKLPKFMIPEVLVNVEAMPLTKNGKIDRKALMEEHNA